MVKHGNRGFTFVEMLVVAPIVILTIGSFIALIIVMSGDVLAARAQNILAYNIQDALTRIENDIKSSSRFLATNSFSLTTPQGYNDATSTFYNVDATQGTVLILEQNATTQNPSSSPSSFAYLANQPYSCASPSLRDNAIMTYNVVYFVKGTGLDATLWRRTLMPANYASAGCNVPWQQPSCTTPAGFCITNDIELVKGVTTSDFSVQYFAAANSTSPNASVSSTATAPATRQTTLETLTTANISIRANALVAGRDVTWAGSLRATRVP